MKLEGLRIGISISDGPDRERLGYPQQEIDRVLITVCMALIRAGARVVYGGNLDPEGYTFKIFRHLAKAYAVHAGHAPFIHAIPFPVLRTTGFEELTGMLSEGRGIVETKAVVGNRLVHLVPDSESDGLLAWRGTTFPGGGVTAIRSAGGFAEWLDESKPDSNAAAFTQARQCLVRECNGRVVMGGKMGLRGRRDDQYQGAIPGIFEEALLTLEAGRATVVLGAFGGASRDLAIELGLLEGPRVPRGEQLESYAAGLKAVRAVRDAFRQSHEQCWDQMVRLAREDRAEELAYGVVQVMEEMSHGAPARALVS